MATGGRQGTGAGIFSRSGAPVRSNNAPARMIVPRPSGKYGTSLATIGRILAAAANCGNSPAAPPDAVDAACAGRRAPWLRQRCPAPIGSRNQAFRTSPAWRGVLSPSVIVDKNATSRTLPSIHLKRILRKSSMGLQCWALPGRSCWLLCHNSTAIGLGEIGMRVLAAKTAGALMTAACLSACVSGGMRLRR